MTRRYPIAKLMRFSKEQWKALTAHCKATEETPTAFIRRIIARELVLSRKS